MKITVVVALTVLLVLTFLAVNVMSKKICPQFKCQRVCKYGYRKNIKGCKVCKCKPPPKDEDDKPKDDDDNTGNKKCKNKIVKCPKSRKRICLRKNGCKVCKCICKKLKCKRRCRIGFKKDRFGCKKCVCLKKKIKKIKKVKEDVNIEP